MFFPGETVTHHFVIPFAANEIDKVVLSYKQKEAIMFEKTLTTGFISDGENITSVEFALTQGEGLLFADDTPFTIQVNVYLKCGTRHTSHELNSSSGVQYLREVIVPEALAIVTQPINQVARNLGDTVTFTVLANGALSYQWQYSVDSGAWKDCTDGNQYSLDVVATQDRVTTHAYRCVMSDMYGNTLTTNTVHILYTDRSDE